jgi:hypothetical protein
VVEAPSSTRLAWLATGISAMAISELEGPMIPSILVSSIIWRTFWTPFVAERSPATVSSKGL